MSEVTTSLETAVLSADKTQTSETRLHETHTLIFILRPLSLSSLTPALRHAALLTFKGEISQLRGQLYQVCKTEIHVHVRTL